MSINIIKVFLITYDNRFILVDACAGASVITIKDGDKTRTFHYVQPEGYDRDARFYETTSQTIENAEIMAQLDKS